MCKKMPCRGPLETQQWQSWGGGVYFHAGRRAIHVCAHEMLESNIQQHRDASKAGPFVASLCAYISFSKETEIDTVSTCLFCVTPQEKQL